MSESTSTNIVESRFSFPCGLFSSVKTTLFVEGNGKTLREIFSEEKEWLRCASLGGRVCFLTWAWDCERCSHNTSLALICTSIIFNRHIISARLVSRVSHASQGNLKKYEERYVGKRKPCGYRFPQPVPTSILMSWEYPETT